MQYSSVTNLGMSYCKSYVIKDAVWCYSWFHLPYGVLLFCITLGIVLEAKGEQNTLKVYRIIRTNCVVLNYSNKVCNWNRDGTKYESQMCAILLSSYWKVINSYQEYLNRKKLPATICKSLQTISKQVDSKVSKCYVQCYTHYHNMVLHQKYSFTWGKLEKTLNQ